MGIILTGNNASFPHAHYGYTSGPNDTIDPPIVYGPDLTINIVTASCPRPVFAGAGWVNRWLTWHVAATQWDRHQIAAKVSNYAVNFYDPPLFGDRVNRDWFCETPSGDTSVANVARRFQRPPTPLPCTLHGSHLWIDAPDYATLHMGRYDRS